MVEGYRHRTWGTPQVRTPCSAHRTLQFTRNCSSKAPIKTGRSTATTPQLNIVMDFYIDLYTPSPVDGSVQEKLLGNVDSTLTNQQRCMLDADLTPKELLSFIRNLGISFQPITPPLFMAPNRSLLATPKTLPLPLSYTRTKGIRKTSRTIAQSPSSMSTSKFFLRL